MHKIILIQELSKDAGIPQKAISDLLASFQKTVMNTLKKGEYVDIIGFGRFKTVKTEAMVRRNPQTGKEMNIKAAKRVKFKVGKTLKDFVRSEINLF